MAYWPLWLWSRSAMGWMARSVFSSASVKSLTNQPSSSKPSTMALRLRLANSGWSLTLVVALMLGSWRATSTPSFVATRSGSMKSAPSSMAFL